MNVLVVAAHPDDELLGCGATLRKLANAGHGIFTCVLCSQADARHARPGLTRFQEVTRDAERMIGVGDSLKYDFLNIRFNTVPHLDIVRAIEAAILQFRPEWVFGHHPGDLNVDHRVAHDATMAAIMLPQRLSTDLPATLVRKALLFEIPSSTDWASPLSAAFRPNCFFDVEETLEDKLRALDAFEGALKPFPHSRSRENIRHLAHIRGGQVGVAAAEAFCVVRELITEVAAT
jgi:LmbE family N-acetylglucosaminyl deacetylase